MELTEIKGSLFGYSKKSVCQYISELNQIQGTELAAEKASAAKAALVYEDKIAELEKDNTAMTKKDEELLDKIAALEIEIGSLKENIEEMEGENASLKESYSVLEAETRELREKSDVISTAIINAEKCATVMLTEADVRAKEMIDQAEVKVADEVKRLDTAKTYIMEVREAVDQALKKISAELGNIEEDIEDKKEDVYSDEKKSGVREKFEMFFKKA